ncbi:unnamed protein product [Arabidopsis halleri]
MEIRMRMRYGENRRRDKGVPIACDCGAAVLVATSRDPNTRGKLYFSCPYEISRWSRSWLRFHEVVDCRIV